MLRRNIQVIVILASLLSVTAVWAADEDSCKAVVSACVSAGFDNAVGQGKQFWKDCMKPVILGGAVEGVTVDNATVHACRLAKIKKLKSELKELESATS